MRVMRRDGNLLFPSSDVCLFVIRWFLMQECLLLKHRLDRLSDEGRYNFLVRNGFSYDEVTQDDKMSLKEKLVGLSGVTEVNILSSKIYRYFCLSFFYF